MILIYSFFFVYNSFWLYFRILFITNLYFSSEELQLQAGVFKRNANELKKKMWWKNIKVKKTLFWQIIDEAPSISSISFNFHSWFVHERPYFTIIWTIEELLHEKSKWNRHKMVIFISNFRLALYFVRLFVRFPFIYLILFPYRFQMWLIIGFIIAVILAIIIGVAVSYSKSASAASNNNGN